VEDRSRRRARLVLIVGFLIAVLAGLATFVLSSGSKTEAPPPVETTPVLVASHDIPPRTALTEADLKVLQYPKDIAPVAALQDSKLVVGKIVQVPVSAGEPILSTKFAPAGAATFTVFPPNAQPVAGQPIAPGTPDYRAISITVADPNAAGGAVAVGDIVDILFTLQFDPTKFLTGTDTNRMADFSSKIVLQNINILARTASVYTIRTDAQTAEKIAYLGAAGGQMQMLLRAAQDQRQALTAGATFGDIYKFGIKIPTKTAP
jgi:pilus assembly protein CpaB